MGPRDGESGVLDLGSGGTARRASQRVVRVSAARTPGSSARRPRSGDPHERAVSQSVTGLRVRCTERMVALERDAHGIPFEVGLAVLNLCSLSSRAPSHPTTAFPTLHVN